jgi:hypothetical protein
MPAMARGVVPCSHPVPRLDEQRQERQLRQCARTSSALAAGKLVPSVVACLGELNRGCRGCVSRVLAISSPTAVGVRAWLTSGLTWVGAVLVGPKWVHKAGMHGWGEKKNFFFWQKRSPSCDFLVIHRPFTLSTSKNI